MNYLNELIRFLRGFVKIKVYGEFTESFINLCAKHGISIWGIEKYKDNMYLYIGADKYLLLISLRHKMKDKVKIKLLEKHGLPFIFKKAGKRKGLLFGFALFLAINLFLSQFVWDIRILGNETIDEKDIVKTCNEMDINVGDYRKNIDTYNAKQLIAMKYDKIAWVSLNMEGAIVTVNISEAKISEHNEDAAPRNIIAAEDGVIKNIKVTKGEKRIVPGQAVKKGDILVSGVVDNVVASHIVPAKGEIIAQTTKNFTFDIEKNYTFETIGREAEIRDVFEFFWLKAPLYLNGVNFEHVSELSRRKIEIFGQKLPIGVARRTFYPIIKNSVELTNLEAECVALTKVAENLKKIDIDEVTSYKTSVVEEDKAYKVNVEVICLENIVEYAPINTDGY